MVIVKPKGAVIPEAAAPQSLLSLAVQRNVSRGLVALKRLGRPPFAIWFPLAVYAAARLLDALFLVVAARHQIELSGIVDRYHVTLPSGAAPDYATVTSNWDGQWYLSIATHGYPTTIPRDVGGHVLENQWGFLPGFPLIVGGLMRITGLSFTMVAPLLNVILGAAAVMVMFRLVSQTCGRFTASATVLLTCTYMAAPAMQIDYSESLALLLVCTALLLLRNRRYGWLVPVLVTLALTRGVALAFAPVLAVHGISRYRRRSVDPFPKPDRWRVAGLGALAIAATGLWPAIAAVTTGDSHAYTQTISSWGGPTERLHLLIQFPVMAWSHAGAVGVCALVLIVVLTAAIVLRRPAEVWGPEVRAWAGSYSLYLLLAVPPGASNIRHLLLAFPLMWPFPEEADSRSERRRRAAMVAMMAICGLATQWVWISNFVVVSGPPGGRAHP